MSGRFARNAEARQVRSDVWLLEPTYPLPAKARPSGRIRLSYSGRRPILALYDQRTRHTRDWIFSGHAPCHGPGPRYRRLDHREPRTLAFTGRLDWSVLGPRSHHYYRPGWRRDYSLQSGHFAARRARDGVCRRTDADFARSPEPYGRQQMAQREIFAGTPTGHRAARAYSPTRPAAALPLALAPARRGTSRRFARNSGLVEQSTLEARAVSLAAPATGGNCSWSGGFGGRGTAGADHHSRPAVGRILFAGFRGRNHRRHDAHHGSLGSAFFPCGDAVHVVKSGPDHGLGIA